MSEHSPGVVENSEFLARFVFSPMHFNRNGKLKPSVFSHVQTRGCSIQRESIANNDHAFAMVQEVLNSNSDTAWQGVLFGQCGDVRSIMVNGNRRSICIYDTADQENPAHGEMCQSEHFEADDFAEIRHDLFVAFANSNLTPPPEYRGGAVWNRLTSHI